MSPTTPQHMPKAFNRIEHKASELRAWTAPAAFAEIGSNWFPGTVQGRQDAIHSASQLAEFRPDIKYRVVGYTPTDVHDIPAPVNTEFINGESYIQRDTHDGTKVWRVVDVNPINKKAVLVNYRDGETHTVVIDPTYANLYRKVS